jgi:hypothetical protein
MASKLAKRLNVSPKANIFAGLHEQLKKGAPMEVLRLRAPLL